jgi:hypothetical protein
MTSRERKLFEAAMEWYDWQLQRGAGSGIRPVETNLANACALFLGKPGLPAQAGEGHPHSPAAVKFTADLMDLKLFHGGAERIADMFDTALAQERAAMARVAAHLAQAAEWEAVAHPKLSTEYKVALATLKALQEPRKP